MKRHRSPVFKAIALAALATFLAGCETESSSSSGGLSVSPSFAKLKSGQSVSISASGCSEYRWSVENPAYGVLGSASGSSVTYTALRDSVTQIVTVRGTFGSSVLTAQATVAQGADSYTSTVTPTTSSSAQAPSSSSSSSSSQSSSSSSSSHSQRLSVSPATATVKNGSSLTFVASGGSDYRWSLEDGSIGRLSSSSGSSVRYTATTDSGSQILTVTATVQGQTATASAEISNAAYEAGENPWR